MLRTFKNDWMKSKTIWWFRTKPHNHHPFPVLSHSPTLSVGQQNITHREVMERVGWQRYIVDDYCEVEGVCDGKQIRDVVKDRPPRVKHSPIAFVHQRPGNTNSRYHSSFIFYFSIILNSCHSCQQGLKTMRDVLLISMAYTWYLPHQHIGLYRDVWIAAIASSRTRLATLTGAMCKTSQCELRSLRVNSGMLNVIRIVTYYTLPTLESPDSFWIAMAISR